MAVCLYVSVCVSICVCLCVCLRVFRYVCLFVYLFVCLPVCQCVCVCFSVCLCVFFRLRMFFSLTPLVYFCCLCFTVCVPLSLSLTPFCLCQSGYLYLSASLSLWLSTPVSLSLIQLPALSLNTSTDMFLTSLPSSIPQITSPCSPPSSLPFHFPPYDNIPIPSSLPPSFFPLPG